MFHSVWWQFPLFEFLYILWQSSLSMIFFSMLFYIDFIRTTCYLALSNLCPDKVQALRGAEVKTYRKAWQEIFVGVYCCRSLFFVRCPSFFIAIRKAGLVFLLGGFIFAIFRQPHSDWKFVIQALSIIIIN